MSTPHRAVNGRASSVGVDFGIVTFLEDELRAVLAYIPPYDTTRGRRIYNRCRLETSTGETYEIAVVRALEFGNSEAIEVVRDLLEELSPRWLLSVGIAGGVGSADLDLGDVVVSSRIADFTAEVALASGERTYAVGGGPIAQEAAIIIANLPALEPEIAGWNVLRAPRPSSASARVPRVAVGLIASSDRLIRDEAVIDTWRKQARGLRAVEMEAAGIYRVASTRNIPFVAIRGVSDIVGKSHKSDDWREYACHAAASFTAAFLRTRPIEPRATRLEPSTPAPAAFDGPLSPRADAPFHVRRLELTDLRGFDQLILPLPPPPADAGQWLVFLGANGVGKTSLLRALALSLSSDEVVQALLGRLGLGAPMVRLRATSATILIECPDGYLPRLVLGAGETGDRLDERGSGEVPPPFVVAYGCRRGSALGGASREVNATSPLSAVETLFDEGAGLVHAETWLKERKLAATLAPGSAEDAFFTAVIATMIEMLPGVRAIQVGAEAIEIEGPGIGRIPLAALSDGYLTTAGWILDMIARWAEDAKRRGIALDGSFRERMTGVAIVDEIDLHLHPRWQRDVVTSVRELFPRMSFVVTTHNPLTILGARTGEIHVLKRDEAKGRIEVLQRDLPPGAGAERILTGEWFELASTLDDETLTLLEEHRQLLRAGKVDDPGTKQLAAELTERLGSYAATSIERLAQSAAAQVLDEEGRNLSAKDREEAQAKIADLLRNSRKPPNPAKNRRTKRRSG